MPTTYNCGLGRVHKALNMKWKDLLHPSVYSIICAFMTDFIDNANAQAWTDCVAYITDNFPYDDVQAETLLRFAFPEIPGGPDSDW